LKVCEKSCDTKFINKCLSVRMSTRKGAHGPTNTITIWCRSGARSRDLFLKGTLQKTTQLPTMAQVEPGKRGLRKIRPYWCIIHRFGHKNVSNACNNIEQIFHGSAITSMNLLKIVLSLPCNFKKIFYMILKFSLTKKYCWKTSIWNCLASEKIDSNHQTV